MADSTPEDVVMFTLMGSTETLSEPAKHWITTPDDGPDYADLVARTCADQYPSVASLIADLDLSACDVLVQVRVGGKWSRKVIAYERGDVDVRDH